MTHRDKCEFVNEVNREFAHAIWRRTISHTRTARKHCTLRVGFTLRPCMARAMLAYTGKHYNVANALYLLNVKLYTLTFCLAVHCRLHVVH